MIVLSTAQIVALHDDLIREFGGTEGVRDENLLDAAVHAPFQTFDGEELFPSICQKAARLGFGLVSNHPFLDGNKRIGAHAMLVFLALNRIDLVYSQQELIDVILRVASGKADFDDLLAWIMDHR